MHTENHYPNRVVLPVSIWDFLGHLLSEVFSVDVAGPRRCDGNDGVGGCAREPQSLLVLTLEGLERQLPHVVDETSEVDKPGECVLESVRGVVLDLGHVLQESLDGSVVLRNNGDMERSEPRWSKDIFVLFFIFVLFSNFDRLCIIWDSWLLLFVVVVLDLLQQTRIDGLEVLEDEAELLVVVDGLGVVQGSPATDDVVVLLQVKEVVLVLKAFLFCELLDLHEGHVAVGEADRVPKVQPAGVAAVESVSAVEAELLLDLRALLAEVVAAHLNSLLCDRDVRASDDVALAAVVPEDLRIELRVEALVLVVLVDLPDQHAVRGWTLAHDDGDSVVLLTNPDLADEGLGLCWVHAELHRDERACSPRSLARTWKVTADHGNLK